MSAGGADCVSRWCRLLRQVVPIASVGGADCLHARRLRTLRGGPRGGPDTEDFMYIV